MDNLYSLGFFLCSVGVLAFTFLQQTKQNAEALEAKNAQLKQKDEIISEFKNLMTGGSSYLFLEPAKIANTNEVLFIFSFKGKYPLYDVSIFIQEFDLKQIGINKLQYQQSDQKTISLGTVNPLQKSSIITVNIPTPKNKEDQFGKRFFFKINS